MSLEKCRECGKEVSTDAVRCPHCGKKLKMGWLAKGAIGIVGTFGLLMVIGMTAEPDPEREAMNKARDVIKLCWKEQSRKSFDASTAQMTAGFCEQFERDFRARYHREP